MPPLMFASIGNWLRSRKREQPTEKHHKKFFTEVMLEYIQAYLAQNQLSKETAMHYDQRYRNIKRYLHSKEMDKATCEDIKIMVMEDLRTWLLNNLMSCGKRHASLHIDLCKRTIKYAVMVEYTDTDRISAIKGQRDKQKEIIALTKEELQLVTDIPLFSPAAREVRDAFVFQCWTGLSYADLGTFKIEVSDGKTWIVNLRQKTESKYAVPLFPEARRILALYGGKLPLHPNQVCNRFLKVIGEKAGIEKYLTTHIGRKTFASRLDQEGFSPRSIALMLGNTIRVCEQHYLAKSTTRIANEWEDLSKRQHEFAQTAS